MNWTPEREAEYQRWRDELVNAPIVDLSLEEIERRIGLIAGDGSWVSLYERLERKAARSRARRRQGR
jgi:hypothetical protein